MNLRTRIRRMELMGQYRKELDELIEFDESRLFRSLKWFMKIWPKELVLYLVLYERESRKNRVGNMKARRKIIIRILMRLARKYGVKIVIKKTFEEVGNARSDYLDTEREVLKEAIAYAKANDCVLVAISVDRFFRPKEFTIKNPFVPVTVADAERFKSILNDDAVVATIIPPGFDKRRLKGVYGKWGQEAKGMKGGRPPKKMPLKERREKFKPIARQLRRNGMSYNEVYEELNTYEELEDNPISLATVVGWIKDIKR